ncbi:MAG TPA: MotA/TolQ/ExbB proton channel family protein [Burkholderiales bacterium]
MFAIIEAAGWPIWFIIVASVVALAIIGERLWTLRHSVVVPRELLPAVVQEYRQKGVTPEMVSRVADSSVLGQILAAGLRNEASSREVMKDAIEESGRAAAKELERFLTSLVTIATSAPLLGLFGTVIGMIEIFGSQAPAGTNPAQLAHGISVALYNTAFGILVAIPALIFYRYFRAKVDAMIVEMELLALKLVEIVHGERQG